MNMAAATSEAPRLFVVTSEQSAARDTAAIRAGIPSRALMQRAGAAAATEIALRYRSRLSAGVLVFTGPGNNGGDGWVVARALAVTGVRVRVVEALPAKSPDAVAERALATSSVEVISWHDGFEASTEGIVVDALLGTGSSGAPRGPIASAVAAINAARRRGAIVVAIDLPTGVDASTGDATGGIDATLTVTFGTVKRGHLVARQACGAITVVDIGLGDHADRGDGAPTIVEQRWVAAHVPRIAADAHKGTRRKLAIIGGASGMAGATILAARAALRSGIGMVRLVVAPESLAAVQSAAPAALGGTWPRSDTDIDREIGWADGLVIGPGLGHAADTRALVERILSRSRGPVVLDADALNVFQGAIEELARSLTGRQALLTPHPAEFARLSGTDVKHVLENRFEIGADLARRLGATVLLKGVPTTITAPDGAARVSAAGTPVLATAGSGDVLSGIAGTLLVQIGDAAIAGAAAAWIHGHASELAARSLQSPSRFVSAREQLETGLSSPSASPGASAVRGVTLEDVIAALSFSWPSSRTLAPRYPVLYELSAVGESA
jgi:ADP-dependent NAD(P)H-hydrate dehydratase / NAD(P)H-hydrate epimerase